MMIIYENITSYTKSSQAGFLLQMVRTGQAGRRPLCFPSAHAVIFFFFCFKFTQVFNASYIAL